MDGGTEDVAMAYLYKNSSIMDSKYLNILNAVRCSRINSNEIFFLYNNAFSYQSKSAPLGLFNATDMSDVTITDFPEYAGAENPVAYNNQFFVRAVVSGKTFTAVTGTVSPSTVVIHEVQLPVSNARMFCDSMYCVKSQMLWLAFVGTGIMFSRDIANGVWGYLDTSSVLGIVTQYGSIEYDEANQQLFIAGKNSTGKYVVGVMKFPNWYDFANDGAFLPMIASNGVPAYIKALDTTTEEA